jgi:hypothetical protein
MPYEYPPAAWVLEFWAPVVGRGHVSLLTNSDTWHPKRVIYDYSRQAKVQICIGRHTISITRRWILGVVRAVERAERGVEHWPGPPFLAVKRPARPYKSTIENTFTVENTEAA